MSRILVYGGSFLAFLVACAFTLTSIIVPRWISWDSSTPSGQQIHYTYGLHTRCSSLTGNCTPFPEPKDCEEDRYFCSMWRSMGFLMSFAVVLEGMTLIAYIVIMAGGKQKREQGWQVLASLHVACAVLLGATMSLTAYLYDHDDRFFPGWKLDFSWTITTVSFAVALLLAAGISASMLLLPDEGGYELIPDDDAGE